MYRLFILAISLSFMFASCSKDDPVIPNEEEVITTLIYTLTPDAGGTAVELQFLDADGDGGDAPEITTSDLSPNTLYVGTVRLLNEQESPAEDVTTEIMEEDEDHQFFYETTVDGLSVSYDDLDSNDQPVGIRTMLQTGDEGSGMLTITLRHEPNKSADGVVISDPSNAGGETDIEVRFPINVQ